MRFVLCITVWKLPDLVKILTFHIRVFDLFLLKQCIPFSFFYRTIVYDNSPTLYTLTHRERTTL